jgi:endonuclease-3
MRDSDIHAAMSILREQHKQWARPAVTRAAAGESAKFSVEQKPFRALVSCIISLRTKDQVTDEASRRLFSIADDPASMSALEPEQVEHAIFPAGFYRVKARNIIEVSRIIRDEHRGRVPDDLESLLELPGVGRKTANLVITKGYGKPGICVDTHVHRICNRWGYVSTRNPDKTEQALRAKLPPEYWIEINELLVSFGQNTCSPVSPFCSRCTVEQYCEKRGVTSSR